MRASGAGSATLSFPRENNLGLLRFVFALQVVLVHAAEHVGGSVHPVIRAFPGVPAFFFVSGFLIYASYQHAPGRVYFTNRFLRLFPGLLFVTLGGLGVVLTARGVDDLILNASEYLLWLLAQLSLGQAYNPSLFRGVGVGVINGSLWTITTEIIFYLLVPLIAHIEKKFSHVVVVFGAVSFVVYSVGGQAFDQTVYGDKTLFDVMSITPLVWGWMFAAGVLAVKHYEQVAAWFRYVPYACFAMIVLVVGDWEGGILAARDNRIGLLYFAAYILVVLYFAFAVRAIRLKTDLSYGLYVWHMPLVNLVLVLGWPRSALLVVVLSIGMAVLSWRLVERPALRQKRETLNATS